jgi:hypothetical protein
MHLISTMNVRSRHGLFLASSIRTLLYSLILDMPKRRDGYDLEDDWEYDSARLIDEIAELYRILVKSCL